jgi:cation channel sperm-associated protein 1
MSRTMCLMATSHHFSSGFAAFSLFQLITLDDWFLMYSEVQQKHPDYWHILIYLVTFIVLENFIFINLFIAVIVDNLERFVVCLNQNNFSVSKFANILEY